MPFSDYVPSFGESNISVYYRNVLGVPIRKRVVVAVLTLFALFLIILGALLYGRYGKKSPRNVKSLYLPYVSMESSIDSSLDPCENFYNFTCSHWPKNKVVSDKKSEHHTVTTFSLLQKFVNEKKEDIFANSKKTDTFPRVVNDAIGFYEMCVNGDTSRETSVTYLLEYLERTLGGWPALNPDNWDGDHFDWIEASAALLETLGLETIVGVFSIIDDYDTDKRLLYFRPLFWDTKSTLHDEFSLNLLRSVITCLNSSDIHGAEMYEYSLKIADTESMWINNFDFNSQEVNDTKMTIKQLQEEVPDFDWLRYVQLVTNNSLNKIDQPITEDDIVVIGQYEHLKTSMTNFLSQNVTKYDLANLFGWFVVQKVFFLIPGVFEEYTKDFGETEEAYSSAIKYKCYGMVKELYPCSLDYLYIHNSSHPGIADGKVLVRYIKNSLKALINDTIWLDNSTKKAAFLKLHSMYSVIGYQDYLGDGKKLDNFYEGQPNLSSSFMQTYFQVKYFSISLSLQEMKLPKFSSYTSPRPVTDVSAYYAPQQNVLTLPLSMYNLPFYHSGGPWYLNFGSLGSIIGHEMMHGFDSAGSQRDEKGTLKNWWSNRSAEAYRLQISCFERQYRAYSGVKMKKGALTTLNEDIADSEGLRIAFLAYRQWVKDHGNEKWFVIGKKNYSPEQVFFIAFSSLWCSSDASTNPEEAADFAHSFRRHRIMGAVSNSEAFSEAFKCKKGSILNRAERCLLW